MPIIRKPKTGGRPENKVVKAYAKKYRLTAKQKALAAKMVVQLSLCQNEEARRLLLGVGERV